MMTLPTTNTIGDQTGSQLRSSRRRKFLAWLIFQAFFPFATAFICWPSDTPIRLNKHNWAEFEGQIPNLKQVIVVADVVQMPHNSLYKAVIENFGRGVHYSFIVSKSKAEKELHGYLEMFHALAQLAIKKYALAQKVTDLVSIEALPDDWDGMPFVFYRVLNTAVPSGKHTAFKTLAFWGDKRCAGIADTYEMLHPAVADALATALKSGAPQPVKEMIHNLERDEYGQMNVFVGRSLPTTPTHGAGN